MPNSIFAPGYKDEPFWWQGAPRPEPGNSALPARVDVAVVGSGYTGLHAAIQTARGGRSTLVLDAEAAGFGCSSRNGGQVSSSIKPSFEELARRTDRDGAFRMRAEGLAALEFTADFIEREHLQCRFERVGRFHAAHNPARYEALARAIADQPKGLEVEAYMVPRAEQSTEIGTDAYHGGCVYPRHAALDPGLYHLELLRLARAAGADLAAYCPVTAIERDGSEFVVSTARGRVRARDVIIATNGYTGPGFPWQRRRVIPIGSYIIATEPLPAETAARIIPQGRVVSDTRKVVYYYRLCPDRRRVLFGGRVAYAETDPRKSAPRLHRDLRQLFPELASVRITHSWMGFVAYTFDTVPHTGVHEGVHYAMGYCGSGISLASYFGMRIGLRVLGSPDGRTAFDELPFPTRPLYTGHPWFLGPALLWYRFHDRLNV